MKIHCLETGKVKVKKNQISRSRIFFPLPNPLPVLLGREWSDWLPIHAWVIEHPEGVIVVDSGETAKTANSGYFPGWHPYFRRAVVMDVSPDEEIGPRLHQLGINQVKDVRLLILTHLHTDHMGGIYHFPESDILVDRKEYQAAQGFLGQLQGYLPQHLPPWFAPRFFSWDDGPFGPFPAHQRLTRDGRVLAVPTPGHSPGHLSVIVQLDERYVFLAGDTSYTQHNLVAGIPDGVSSGESLKTMEKIRQFCEAFPTVYLPAHDPEARHRLENMEIVNSKTTGNQLKRKDAR